MNQSRQTHSLYTLYHSTLQAGMALLSVDGRNVAGCTVDEAKKVINTSYLDKQHVSMKLEVLPMERSTTM